MFPLHNWLPDAHSEAPSPASAMLSGALLNCALVAIWRLSLVMIAAGQQDVVSHLLVPAGALTVLAASLMLVRQHDLKRMWAYSSMEHVGLMTLAIGIGSGSIFILQAFNHSVVKVALFLVAGNIVHLYGSKALSKLGGLLKVAPAWGVVLVAGSFAIAGSPPFGTFISEWLLLRDTIALGHIWAAASVLIGLTITLIALSMHVGRVALGRAPASLSVVPVRAWALTPALLLGISLAGGLGIAPAAIRFLGVLAKGGAP
jgi:hydrogenase-4 component F